jgi:hypothetical protein
MRPLNDASQGRPERDDLEAHPAERAAALEEELTALADRYNLKIGAFCVVDRYGLHALNFGPPTGVSLRLKDMLFQVLNHLGAEVEVVAELRRIVEEAHEQN